MNSFNTYVINLDDSDDRLASISKHLKERGIVFQRIAAIDMRDKEVSNIVEYDDGAAQHFMGRSLVPGEIGCYLSHRKALEQFVKSGAEFGLILEDDALLPKDFASYLNNVLNWIKNNWHTQWSVINLGYSKAKYFSKIAIFDHRQLVTAHYAPMGAFAILWNRKAAQAFLNDCYPIELPFDNALQNRFTKMGGCLRVVPSGVTVMNVESTLDGTSAFKKPNRGKNKRSASYGYLKQKRLWTNRYWAIKNKYLN